MKITKKKAIALMERAVKERGADWTFPINASPRGCFYVLDNDVMEECEGNAFDDDDPDLHGLHAGDPACLVGLALSYLGNKTIMRDLRIANFENVSTVAERLDEDGIVLTDKAKWALGVAQQCQDVGDSWGTALEEAKRQQMPRRFSH